MSRSLQSLLKSLSSTSSVQIEGNSDTDGIIFITDDSRKANSGCIFSATAIGENFIQDAKNRGAKVFLISDEMELSGDFSDCVLIRTDQLEKVQGSLASELNGNPSQSLYLVGVTGTNGKTSVTHMLYHIWKNEGIRAGMIGTLGVKYQSAEDQEISFSTGYTTPRAGELQAILKTMMDSGVTDRKSGFTLVR